MTTEELLARLDERTKQMHEDFQTFLRHADNGGWKRCVERKSKMEETEKKVKSHLADHKWTNRAITAVVLSQLIQAFFTFVGPKVTGG